MRQCWVVLIGVLLTVVCAAGCHGMRFTPARVELVTTPDTVTPGIRDYLDELACIQLESAACAVSLYPYFTRIAPFDEQHREEMSQALARLRVHNDQLPIPYSLRTLRRMNGTMMNELEQVCERLARGVPEEAERTYQSFYDAYQPRYQRAFERMCRAHHIGFVREAIDTRDEEIGMLDSLEDGNDYRDALQSIKDEYPAEAYPLLMSLGERYADTAGGDCIALRRADCLLVSASHTNAESFTVHEPKRAAYAALVTIMEGGRYSPVLYEAFVKWRTLKQTLDYGVSNLAVIPNSEYNQVRYRLVRTIKSYLATEPDDAWARAQIDLLLTESNMTRSGSYGRSALTYVGALHGREKK